MYLMNCTRPDIAYVIGRLNMYTSNPNSELWGVLIRVLRYLRYSLDWGIRYTRFTAVLEGYCDANWIFDTNECKSTNGYVFTLVGRAVSWKSIKQTCIMRSTMELEFISLDKAGESPSSSASGIDNLNNLMVDKAVLSKGNGSQAGNHIIVP
ncbi:unnamed protein product [Fraxinus pennsylvanica]|uniref:CWZF3/5/7 THD domain-containing protein n=1 Tax=Fraxinus pennsylvanica TaxID=56036 RepID=A0AAD2DVE8_9LAMI|nr:unnamed protein product [Fraxinus pennsylvanica]